MSIYYDFVLYEIIKYIIIVVGSEGPRGFDTFDLKPKVHVEEEEVPSDEMKGIQTARTYC